MEILIKNEENIYKIIGCNEVSIYLKNIDTNTISVMGIDWFYIQFMEQVIKSLNTKHQTEIEIINSSHNNHITIT